MKFAIKIFAAVFLFEILFFQSTEAEEKKTLRLVQLPIIFQSRQPDFDTCAILETKITRATHIPLNGTLKLLEYVDKTESSSALNEIWRQMRSQNKKAKISGAMKPLAEKINADSRTANRDRQWRNHFSCTSTCRISRRNPRLNIFRRTDYRTLHCHNLQLSE